jgi:hypothetical protein
MFPLLDSGSVRRFRCVRPLGLLVAGLVGACESTGPDEREQRLEPGTVAVGRLASAADTVVYAADVNPGDTLRLFLQVTSGTRSDVLGAEVFDHHVLGTSFLRTTAVGDPAFLLDANGTGWREVPEGARMAVRVFLREGGPTVPFRVMLGQQGAAPESRSAEISLGEVVSGESFAFNGEPDEFRFFASVGERVIVMYRPTAGAAFAAQGAIRGPSGDLEGLYFPGVPSSLEANASSRINIRETGVQRLLLIASTPTDNKPVPYEFRVQRAP